MTTTRNDHESGFDYYLPGRGRFDNDFEELKDRIARILFEASHPHERWADVGFIDRRTNIYRRAANTVALAFLRDELRRAEVRKAIRGEVALYRRNCRQGRGEAA